MAATTGAGTSRKTLVLAAMIFAVAMTFIDQTIVAIAVPKIQAELHLSINGVQWVINAYLLALTSMFAFGGRLADTVGHRKMVVIGIVVFTLASIACGLTPGHGSAAEAWIVTFRVVQGIGGAIMYPAALAIVVAAFPVRERGRALAIFFGVSGGLTAIGPILGGYLSEWTWRAIFWVNVPVAIIALVLTAIARPQTETRPGRLDFRGLALIASGVGLAIFGLQQTQVWGWTNPVVIACMAAGVLLLVGFFYLEPRISEPLIDVRTFRIRAFAVQNAVLFIAMIVFIPIFFFASIYAQVSLGDGPQEAGLYLLVFFAGFAPGVQVGGRRLDRSGAKIPVVAGCVIAAVGLALWGSSVTRLSLNNQWYYIIIAGFGLGLMLGPSNTDAINQVGRLSYGEATGVTQTTRNFGASFGLAFLGTLLVSVERNHLVSPADRARPLVRHRAQRGQDDRAEPRVRAALRRARRVRHARVPRRPAQPRGRHPGRPVRDGSGDGSRGPRGQGRPAPRNPRGRRQHRRTGTVGLRDCRRARGGPHSGLRNWPRSRARGDGRARLIRCRARRRARAGRRKRDRRGPPRVLAALGVPVVDRPLAVQDRHGVRVDPLAVPEQGVAHRALVDEADLLVDPAGPQVEGVDRELNPVQADRLEGVAQDQPGCLGAEAAAAVPVVEQRDPEVAGPVVRIQPVEHDLARVTAGSLVDDSQVQPVVEVRASGVPVLAHLDRELPVVAGEPVTLGIGVKRRSDVGDLDRPEQNLLAGQRWLIGHGNRGSHGHRACRRDSGRSIRFRPSVHRLASGGAGDPAGYWAAVAHAQLRARDNRRMTVARSIGLFIAAGLAEIGGGYLIWRWLREGAPVVLGVLGAIILVIYGIIPTLQRSHDFGRIYAAYGGVFVVASLLWGWGFDGARPDRWDVTGAAVVLAGVGIIYFAPRG